MCHVHDHPTARRCLPGEPATGLSASTKSRTAASAAVSQFAADYRLDAEGRRFWGLVFPDPDDCPTSLAQCAVCEPVTFPVAGDLARPVGGVAGGRPVMLGAAVPPASVDEYGYPGASEDHVSGVPSSAQRPGVDEIPEAASMDQAPDGHLGGGVTTAIGLHGPARRGRGGPRLTDCVGSARRISGLLVRLVQTCVLGCLRARSGHFARWRRHESSS